jgi:hypothetical protein
VRRWRGEVDPERVWRLFTLPVPGTCSACLAVEHREEEEDCRFVIRETIEA